MSDPEYWRMSEDSIAAEVETALDRYLGAGGRDRVEAGAETGDERIAV